MPTRRRRQPRRSREAGRNRNDSLWPAEQYNTNPRVPPPAPHASPSTMEIRAHAVDGGNTMFTMSHYFRERALERMPVYHDPRFYEISRAWLLKVGEERPSISTFEDRPRNDSDEDSDSSSPCSLASTASVDSVSEPEFTPDPSEAELPVLEQSPPTPPTPLKPVGRSVSMVNRAREAVAPLPRPRPGRPSRPPCVPRRKVEPEPEPEPDEPEPIREEVRQPPRPPEPVRDLVRHPCWETVERPPSLPQVSLEPRPGLMCIPITPVPCPSPPQPVCVPPARRPALVTPQPVCESTVRRPAREPAQPVCEPTVRRPAREPAQPICEPTVRRPAREPAQPVCEPTVRRPAREPAQPVCEPPVRRPAREPAQPVCEPTVRRRAREPPQPVCEPPVRRPAREPAQPVCEPPARRPAREPAQPVCEPTVRRRAREPAQPVCEPSVRRPAREPAQPTCESPVRRPACQPIVLPPIPAWSPPKTQQVSVPAAQQPVTSPTLNRKYSEESGSTSSSEEAIISVPVLVNFDGSGSSSAASDEEYDVELEVVLPVMERLSSSSWGSSVTEFPDSRCGSGQESTRPTSPNVPESKSDLIVKVEQFPKLVYKPPRTSSNRPASAPQLIEIQETIHFDVPSSLRNQRIPLTIIVPAKPLSTRESQISEMSSTSTQEFNQTVPIEVGIITSSESSENDIAITGEDLPEYTEIPKKSRVPSPEREWEEPSLPISTILTHKPVPTKENQDLDKPPTFTQESKRSAPTKEEIVPVSYENVPSYQDSDKPPVFKQESKRAAPTKEKIIPVTNENVQSYQDSDTPPASMRESNRAAPTKAENIPVSKENIQSFQDSDTPPGFMQESRRSAPTKAEIIPVSKERVQSYQDSYKPPASMQESKRSPPAKREIIPVSKEKVQYYQDSDKPPASMQESKRSPPAKREILPVSKEIVQSDRKSDKPPTYRQESKRSTPTRQGIVSISNENAQSYQDLDKPPGYMQESERSAPTKEGIFPLTKENVESFQDSNKPPAYMQESKRSSPTKAELLTVSKESFQYISDEDLEMEAIVEARHLFSAKSSFTELCEGKTAPGTPYCEGTDTAPGTAYYEEPQTCESLAGIPEPEPEPASCVKPEPVKEWTIYRPEWSNKTRLSPTRSVTSRQPLPPPSPRKAGPRSASAPGRQRDTFVVPRRVPSSKYERMLPPGQKIICTSRPPYQRVHKKIPARIPYKPRVQKPPPRFVSRKPRVSIYERIPPPAQKLVVEPAEKKFLFGSWKPAFQPVKKRKSSQHKIESEEDEPMICEPEVEGAQQLWRPFYHGNKVKNNYFLDAPESRVCIPHPGKVILPKPDIEPGFRDHLRKNILDAIRQPEKVPVPRYVDHSNGDRFNWCRSGFAREYVYKQDFGKVPAYIQTRKRELQECATSGDVDSDSGSDSDYMSSRQTDQSVSKYCKIKNNEVRNLYH